jgi:hypothetical protein
LCFTLPIITGKMAKSEGEMAMAEENGGEPSSAPATPKEARSQKATKRPSGKKASRPKKRGQPIKANPAPRRPYPRTPLETAIKIPFVLKDKNGGNPWPPSDVAAGIGLSFKNTDFFYMAASSRDFGLTEGSRDSSLISLTEFGRQLVYPPNPEEEKRLLRQALLNVEIFKKVLDYYKGSNLPEMQYLGNTLVREFDLHPDFHEEFSRLFKENCKFLEIGSGFSPEISASPREPRQIDGSSTVILAEPKKDTGLRCFVAMPFREREAARSKGFFDEVLSALIVPAAREAGFEVITANRDGSDVIQATIVNQLLDSDMVIADLTENNPNVLFELGLRIAEDKPIALIRAKGTPAIFDVDNMLRVFEYDNTLWSSSIQHDLPRLTEHVKGAWAARESNLSYMKILRERKT